MNVKIYFYLVTVYIFLLYFHLEIILFDICLNKLLE